MLGTCRCLGTLCGDAGPGLAPSLCGPRDKLLGLVGRSSPDTRHPRRSGIIRSWRRVLYPIQNPPPNSSSLVPAIPKLSSQSLGASAYLRRSTARRSVKGQRQQFALVAVATSSRPPLIDFTCASLVKTQRHGPQARQLGLRLVYGALSLPFYDNFCAIVRSSRDAGDRPCGNQFKLSGRPGSGSSPSPSFENPLESSHAVFLVKGGELCGLDTRRYHSVPL